MDAELRAAILRVAQEPAVREGLLYFVSSQSLLDGYSVRGADIVQSLANLQERDVRKLGRAFGELYIDARQEVC